MRWFNDYIYYFEMMIFTIVLGDIPSGVWYVMYYMSPTDRLMKRLYKMLVYPYEETLGEAI